MTLQAWINKPKNQRLLFLVIGVILLYLYLKDKEKAAAVNLGVYGGYTNTGNTGSSTASYLYNSNSLPYTHSNKDFFTLTKNGNSYSDTYPDSVNGGLRQRAANGRTYTVFYWINEIPYANGDGTPKNFVGVTLPPGCFITVRKVYADAAWVTTHQQIFDRGAQAWYLEPGADENRTYKTVIMDITT